MSFNSGLIEQLPFAEVMPESMRDSGAAQTKRGRDLEGYPPPVGYSGTIAPNAPELLRRRPKDLAAQLWCQRAFNQDGGFNLMRAGPAGEAGFIASISIPASCQSDKT